MRDLKYIFILALYFFSTGAFAEDPSATKIRDLENRLKILEEKTDASNLRATSRILPDTVLIYIPPITTREDEVSAPRTDNAPLDPKLKGFMHIPDSSTVFKIGGYAKLDMISDLNPVGNSEQFITSSIPTSEPDKSRTGQFTITAKQTRVNVDVRRNTEQGDVRMFFESDLYAYSPSDFSRDNRYQLRIRHAFGQLGNFRVGLSFSSFMDIDAFPDTLDFAGPDSIPYLLNAQIGYSQHFTPSSIWRVSFEQPTSQVTAPAGSNSISQFPDFVLQLRYEHEDTHLQLAGILRQLGYENTNVDKKTMGAGISFGASYKISSKNYFVLGGAAGRGIARYINDVSGANADASVAPDGNIEALNTYGAYLGYTHHWSDKLRSTAVAGRLRQDNKDFQAAVAFHESQYYSINLVSNIVGSLNIGLEYLHGEHMTADKATGQANRLQASVQYVLVR